MLRSAEQTPYADKPQQSIPGIVGWGAERPSLAVLQDAAAAAASPPAASEDSKLHADGDASAVCVSAAARALLVPFMHRCWAQVSFCF
jgi:hypothetical protein